MSQHELSRLSPRHFRILDLALEGLSKKDIAMAVGMTPQAISLITKSPLFQDQLERRRNHIERKTDEAIGATVVDARNHLQQHALEAAETQVSLLEAENESVRLHSATAILDRVMETSDKNKVDAPLINVESLQVLVQAMGESQNGRTAEHSEQPEGSE